MPAALVLTQVWYRSVHGASAMLCSALPCGIARPPLTGPALTSRRPAPPPLCCPRDRERGTGETPTPLPNWPIPLPKHLIILQYQAPFWGVLAACRMQMRISNFCAMVKKSCPPLQPPGAGRMSMYPWDASEQEELDVTKAVPAHGT